MRTALLYLIYLKLSKSAIQDVKEGTNVVVVVIGVVPLGLEDHGWAVEDHSQAGAVAVVGVGTGPGIEVLTLIEHSFYECKFFLQYWCEQYWTGLNEC